uniref:Uncharacterized protein n=1 Tax=Archaeoglobus fulgidus TaxID=2234 RepID=A0A7C3RNF1_ARCFL
MNRSLTLGLLLTVSFFAVLAYMVTPSFDGENFLAYADLKFNQYAKASSYFIPDVKIGLEEYKDREFTFTVEMKNSEEAEKTTLLYEKAGAMVSVDNAKVTISGSMALLYSALEDADAAFNNDAAYFTEKYGISARETLYLWYTSLNVLAKQLEKEHRFEESLYVKNQVITRAIEPAYNFYGIEASPMDILGAGLLVFYVVYTLWWGFAIYYVFEGLGIKLTKAKEKKEV